jgi:hypothetical protein
MAARSATPCTPDKKSRGETFRRGRRATNLLAVLIAAIRMDNPVAGIPLRPNQQQ